MAKKKTKMKSSVKAKARPKAKPQKKVAAAKRKPVVKVARPKPERQTAAAATTKKPGYVTAGSQHVNPLLVVRDIKAAIEFMTNALGFTLRASMPGPDGKLMHAELMLGDSLVMLGPENRDMGSTAPQGPSPVTLYIFVSNVDEVTARASAHGGHIALKPDDMFWGDRCSVVLDPDGHSWMIATHYAEIPYDKMKLPSA